MSLSKKTIKLLEKVSAHILEEPKRIKMETWAEGHTKEGGEIPACKTVGCIAGWTILLEKPTIWKALLKAAREEEEVYGEQADTVELDSLNAFYNKSVSKRAAEILDITYEQSQRLFIFPNWGIFGAGWPKKFATLYEKAKTPRGRARAAVNRIKHFIKTDGKE